MGPKWVLLIGAKVGHIQNPYGAQMGDHTEPTNSPYMGFLWDHSGSELGPIYISLLIPLDKINVLICNKTLNYNVFDLISVDFMWCSIHFKLHVNC